MIVGEICNRQVVVARRTDTVPAAAREMRDYNVGDVVVVDEIEEQRVPIGILTDRDIVVVGVAEHAGRMDTLTVGDIMSTTLVTAREDENLFDVLKRMRAHGIRRLPVVNADGGLEGIFTHDDAVDLLSEELADLSALVSREQKRGRKPAIS